MSTPAPLIPSSIDEFREINTETTEIRTHGALPGNDSEIDCDASGKGIDATRDWFATDRDVCSVDCQTIVRPLAGEPSYIDGYVDRKSIYQFSGGITKDRGIDAERSIGLAPR
ncbi:hypothetical protein WHR41_07948 [Cladosporium halotolerans]|uniref:Uncharacterized protein n=1 Tax=Cladosporium halotolerans TaxID=1052096 RepID=A0AB34KIW1_9PEZI